jgi:prophage regulatory protein
MQPISPDQLLRITEVSRVTSLAKSTINLWVAQGKFPRPLTLSPTIKVWRSQSLIDWIESQTENSSPITTESKHSRELGEI